MSGGSMNYIYDQIYEASILASDPEICELLKDVSKVLHDEEWWKSADYGKDTYLKSLAEFKQKWFKTTREERLKDYIDRELEKQREALYGLIGLDDDRKDEQNADGTK